MATATERSGQGPRTRRGLGPHAAYEAGRYAAKLASGMCRICGARPPRAEGTYHCAGCLADKRARAKLLARAGLCQGCKAPVEPGRRLCRPCLERDRERRRERRKARLAAGICRNCWRPRDTDSPACARCRKKACQMTTIKYHSRRADGACPACSGRRKSRPGRRTCARCAELRERRMRARRARELETGAYRRCAFPGCERPQRSLRLCSSHYAQQHRGKPLTPLREPRGGRKSRA